MARYCKTFSTDEVRILLRVSEGRPTPYAPSRARVVDGAVRPTAAAHPVSQHLEPRGRLLGELAMAQEKKKSVFRKRADMVEAATAVLNSREGQRLLLELGTQPAGSRVVIKWPVPKLFDLMVSDKHGVVTTRTAAAQAGAGSTETQCTMVVDSYEGDFHILVQSFYAKPG